MNWFILALGAPFLWALVNISDDYLVGRFSRKNNPVGALVLFSSVIGLVVAFLIFLLGFEVFSLPLSYKIDLMFLGVLTLVWNIFYLFSLTLEDVSAVVPWFLTIPVFNYFLGYYFLDEVLTLHQIIGSLIVLLGALIISIDYEKRKFVFKEKVALLMLSASFIISMVTVSFKHITTTHSFWSASFWQYSGLGLCGAAIFIFIPAYRRAFLQMNREGGKTIFSLNVLSEFSNSAGSLLTTYATLLAPVALVSLVATYQPVIVLILSFVCTKFFPFIVKEDFSWRRLWPKLLAIAIMILGSSFIFQ